MFACTAVLFSVAYHVAHRLCFYANFNWREADRLTQVLLLALTRVLLVATVVSLWWNGDEEAGMCLLQVQHLNPAYNTQA